jgi:mannose-6-phosphate isomerase-like protein (cupin superfamily)
MVLYCLLRRNGANGNVEFFMVRKQAHLTFPPTKFRPGENLSKALVRPLEEDLSLPRGSYYPEEELEMIPHHGNSIRYPGLTKQWYLYPVTISLTSDAVTQLEALNPKAEWMTIDQMLSKMKEPNVLEIAAYIKDKRPDLLDTAIAGPSMDALASDWASRNDGGIRVVRNQKLQEILDVGSRAFNLRVADPYLPYQKQGLGFTWSFFTPKDKQDIHVHGQPAVEIYGVLEGRLQIWFKPMNQRGVRSWQKMTLEAGDWAEVEALYCHFAFWVGRQGKGTVIKAAAGGELAGVGKIGQAGKTVCRDCNVQNQCMQHPRMMELMVEYQKEFNERDYEKIAMLASE